MQTINTYSLKKSLFGAAMVADEKGLWASRDEVLKDLGKNLKDLSDEKAELEEALRDVAERQTELTQEENLMDSRRTEATDWEFKAEDLRKRLEAKHDAWDEMRKQKEALDEIATNTQRLLNVERKSNADTVQDVTKAVALLKESVARETTLQTQLEESLELTHAAQKEVLAHAAIITKQGAIITRQDELEEAGKRPLTVDETMHPPKDTVLEDPLLSAPIAPKETLKELELQSLLEVAVEKLKEAAVNKKALEELVDQVHQGAATSMAAMPNLRPFEMMQAIADPGKSVLQTWAEAMWPQLSAEIQAEILLWHAQSLTDPELVKQQMALIQDIQAGTYSPSAIPKQSALPTEVQESAAPLPDSNGTNTTPQD